MEKGQQSRGTQDITVVWIVFILLVIGMIAVYWYMLYQPKKDEIARIQASIVSKQSTLESYKTEAKQLLNYEDEFGALVHAWNANQHFFVNGLKFDDSTGTYKKQYEGREQFAIFDTLETVFSAGRFAGIHIAEMIVAEGLDFYMDDEPFEVPSDLQGAIGWTYNLSNRAENADPLFTSHNFSIKFFGDLESTRRFIEILQKLEGDVTKIFSVHCFETADKAAVHVYSVGFGETVLTDITLEIDMSLSVYELNPDAASPNNPPDIPGTSSCSYGSAGGGGGGGGGGGRGGSGGGIGLGL
ncbi:MAG: hypothetical protein NTY09_04160 [bacterium]|nr:hypothetical protein [bacterium]